MFICNDVGRIPGISVEIVVSVPDGELAIIVCFGFVSFLVFEKISEATVTATIKKDKAKKMINNIPKNVEVRFLFI